MICPFCNNKELLISLRPIVLQFYCDKCCSRGFSDHIVYLENSIKTNEHFRINNFYVKVDFENKRTLIYKLKYAMLFDEICINSAIEFNLFNKEECINKITTYVLYS